MYSCNRHLLAAAVCQGQNWLHTQLKFESAALAVAVSKSALTVTVGAVCAALSVEKDHVGLHRQPSSLQRLGAKAA